MNKQLRARRRKIALITAPILLLLTVFYGLSYGSVSISLSEIWTIFTTKGHSAHDTIIMNLRLPRVLVGLLTGACLAAAGAILQGVMRNPLADPGIIGVSAGGGLAAVITMVLLPQLSYLLPAAAFIGAFATSIIIYLISWDKGTSPVKIVLAGVAINALLGAIMNGIMVVYSDRIQAVLPWLSGGLNGRSWYHLSLWPLMHLLDLV